MADLLRAVIFSLEKKAKEASGKVGKVSHKLPRPAVFGIKVLPSLEINSCICHVGTGFCGSVPGGQSVASRSNIHW